MELNDITCKINGAIYEVNRVLGAGFLEKVYEKALLLELKERGLRVESQKSIPVFYKGAVVGDYFADILVEERILLELKSVNQLNGNHEAQVLNYLKATGLRVGLLVNFTHPKAVIKRFVF